MSKIGVSVIGLGRAGKIHAEIFKHEIPGADLVCVSDEIESVARQMGEELKVDWIMGYERVLKRNDVDAVIIATPTHSHAKIAIEALEMGKSVFVEKPLSKSLDEAMNVVHKASSSSLIVQVGYMRRFDEAYKKAKEMILKGKFGTPVIYRSIAHDPAPPPGWASDPNLSGGIFYDMLSHDFDMARHLMSSEVLMVYAIGSNFLYEELKAKGDYDCASVIMTFNSGAHGYVEGIRKCTYGYDLRTEIVGTEGSIIVGSLSDDSLTTANSDGIKRMGVQWFMQRFRNAFFEEDRSFVRSISQNSEPAVTVWDGLRAVEIAEACRMSAKQGKPVSLNALR